MSAITAGITSEEPAPRVTLAWVGEIPVFIRGSIDALSPSQTLRMDEIERAVAAGRDDAGKLAAAFEASQGITDADRMAAVGPAEPWERDFDAAFAAHFLRPASAEAPVRVELPDHERGRSPDELKRLDRILKKLGDPGLTVKDRDELLDEMAKIERAPREWRDVQWLKEATAETEALAVARGEEVGNDRGGMRRILDRDPLLTLARAGHLTADQLETAQIVRELYDSRAQDAGAMEYSGMPSAAHDHEKFVSTRFERAKASAMLGRMERVIAITCSAEPACLVMMRIVCERGLAVSSQGKGRAFERNCAALARAMDVADDVLKRRA
jgi:hypothetical protein